jgi:hypothetical protein
MLATCPRDGILSSCCQHLLVLATCHRAVNALMLASCPHTSNHPHAGILSSNLATCPHAGYLCSCSQPLFLLATCPHAGICAHALNLSSCWQPVLVLTTCVVPSCWKPCRAYPRASNLSSCWKPVFMLATCPRSRNLAS